MTIEIIQEPVIRLSRADHDRLLGIYTMEHRVWASVTPPPSFETWLRARGYGR